METWPPAPTNDLPEPKRPQAWQNNFIGCSALTLSALFVLTVIAGFFGPTRVLHGLGFSFAMLTLVLGFVSRATLFGRLALLGLLSYVGIIVYYIVQWYQG